MLLWAYLPAAACLGIGTLGWSLALLHRRGTLPRWCALTCNPLRWLLGLHLLQRVMPIPWAVATEAATFNLIMLAIFPQTTVLAWQPGRIAMA